MAHSSSQSTTWAPPDDPLGAFCRPNHVSLKGAGQGPLAGLTFAVKDCFDIAGTPTGFGQPTWLQSAPVPSATAPAVQKLLAAGADMVAKTVCDELCYSLTGENAHYGAPVNVNAPGRVSGGSSSGSAAAVAGGLVDFAIGTDCGGSVRIPASFCGVLGLRPTHGRIPLDGVLPFAGSFDVVGWFARDPAIFECVGQTLMGTEADMAPPRRLLVLTDAFDLVDPAVTLALGPSLEKLKALVPTVEAINLSEDSLPAWFDTFRTIQACEIWDNLGGWIGRAKPSLGPGIKERMAWAAALEPAAIARAKDARRLIRARIEALIAPGDVLCLPTSPRVAPLRNSPVSEVEGSYREQAMRLLCIAGLAGLPQLSLPLARLDGLPLGLSIAGPRGSDLSLLALARHAMADATANFPS